MKKYYIIGQVIGQVIGVILTFIIIAFVTKLVVESDLPLWLKVLILK